MSDLQEQLDEHPNAAPEVTPITFCLAITHLPGASAARDTNLRKLIADLAIDSPLAPGQFLLLTDKAENHVWSEKMWRWALSTGASHCLFLQDDVEVFPKFWAALTAMVSAHPDMIIGLQTVHPLAPVLAREEVRGCTTSDGLVGVGYLVPRPILSEFLPWRETALKPGAIESKLPDGRAALSEDTCLGIFCLHTNRRIYHPIPTIIAHRTDIASTYGNDTASNRVSPVTWKHVYKPHAWTRDPIGWDPEALTHTEFWASPPRHVGRMYDLSPFIAREMIRDVTNEQMVAWRADNSRREIQRASHLRRINGPKLARRIFIATPMMGDPTANFAASLWQLLKDEELELENPYEITDIIQRAQDLVRVRSRFVNQMLHETDATELLFADSDTIFEPKVIRGMLAAMFPKEGERRHFIACPYPRRDEIHWGRVRDPKLQMMTPEGAAYRYNVRFLDRENMAVSPDGCVEIEGIGLGCALISRELLEGLEKYYAEEQLDYDRMVRDFLAETLSLLGPEAKLRDAAAEVLQFAQFAAAAGRERPVLTFEDQLPGLNGCKVPTTALFQLSFREGGLLSEDYSFCRRVREFGQKVWMYLGDGSPVHHEGPWVFRGDLTAFGLIKRG